FTVGNFNIVLLNATSNSGATPPPALDQLNATALTVTNIGSLTQTLIINASDVGFAPPATGQPLNLSDSGSVTFTSGSAGDSAALTSYADPNNIFFSTANPTPASNISWSGNGTVLLPVQTTTFSLGGNPNFSMSNAFVLVLNPGDTVNLSYTSNVTPEPVSLAIMGLGGGLALLRQRKRLRA
ncbi:MAG TPA: PEP-CTERM sorting domain-containing protein, partial [Phycisphaerae bacterium]|nr:PEP-CTERM sorting domain-containing protein [Phycisphaerae bacterium]